MNPIPIQAKGMNLISENWSVERSSSLEIDFVDMPESKEEWEDVFPLFIEMTKPEKLDQLIVNIHEIATDYDFNAGLPIHNEDQMKLMKYVFQEWIKSMFIDYKYG